MNQGLGQDTVKRAAKVTSETQSKAIVFARPLGFQEWLALDRLANGLLQMSSQHYLSADHVDSKKRESIVVRPWYSWVSWIFISVGSAEFPWDLTKDIPPNEKGSIYYFGSGFNENEKKTLKKYYKEFQEWEGFREEVFSISYLP